MKYTGERLTTEINPNYGIIEHLHRYALAFEYTENKTVLDIACGEGYGTNLISKNAKYITGVDISSEAINFALKKYKGDNISFLLGDVTSIPVNDDSIDVIISFETLEHVEKQDEMILEFTRVLKKNGILIISTPDSRIYKKRDPDNPFHIKELDENEFILLLEKYFDNIYLLKQKFVIGSMIENTKKEKHIDSYYGDFNIVSKNKGNPDDFFNNYFFNVALASNLKLESPNHSFFDSSILQDKILQKEFSKRINGIKIRSRLFFGYPYYLLKSMVKYIRRHLD